jgi:demethylmenaquinone methyltransferase/2-methoxy-6-polyprenyl-1,4-benzoquinol methylase
MPQAGKNTDFGFQRVPLEDKQALVDDVFRSVARRYDLMNDLMSGGLHRAWKDALVTAVNPPKGRQSADSHGEPKARPGRLDEPKARPGRLDEPKDRPGRLDEPKGRPGRLDDKHERAFHLLDIAGGTGDIAFRTIAAGGSGTRATVIDINADMLEVGRARAAEHGVDDAVAFIEGNAEALPFPARSYDAVTIAFGIRNVPRIETALAEAHRVLRFGGQFLCLEFSAVDVPGLDTLYDFYSFNVIPALGRAVAGDADAYRYLVESIRRFPRPDAFAEMMRKAGFARVSYQRMTGGIVALHSGWRL